MNKREPGVHGQGQTFHGRAGQAQDHGHHGPALDHGQRLDLTQADHLVEDLEDQVLATVHLEVDGVLGALLERGQTTHGLHGGRTMDVHPVHGVVGLVDHGQRMLLGRHGVVALLRQLAAQFIPLRPAVAW